MRAASGDAWSGKIAWEVASFLVTLVLLHVVFACVTWLLACATAIFSPTARAKFGRIVVGWFCVLAGIAIVYNALWYPRTLIGAYYHDAVAAPAGPWPIGQVAYYAGFGLCLLVLGRAALLLYVRSGRTARRRSLWAASAAALLAAITLLWPADRSGVAAASTAGRPNIIILGIDSLRLEQMRRFGGSGVTPNLDRFLAKADIFSDATTPSGADILVLGRNTVRTFADRDGSTIQPGRALDCECQPHDRGCPEEGRIPHDLFDRRSPIREFRRDLRIRPGRYSTHRSLRFHHRDLQRAAVALDGRQYPARQVVVPVFVRQSRCRDDVRAGDIRRTPRSRSLVRRADAFHLAPDCRALAVLHGRHAIRRFHASL